LLVIAHFIFFYGSKTIRKIAFHESLTLQTTLVSVNCRFCPHSSVL